VRRVSEYYTVTYRTVHTDLLTVDSARYCDRTYDILADLEWQTLGGGKRPLAIALPITTLAKNTILHFACINNSLVKLSSNFLY